VIIGDAGDVSTNIDEDFILKNSLEYLSQVFKQHPDLYFKCWNNIKQNNDQAKFEKLSNLALLSKIDENQVFEHTTSPSERIRYIATFVTIRIFMYRMKTNHDFDIDIVLNRLRDVYHPIRVVVVREIFSFYEKFGTLVIDKLLLALHDSKDEVRVEVLRTLRRLYNKYKMEIGFVDIIKRLASDGISSSTRSEAADFLYDVFSAEDKEDDLFGVLVNCHPNKIKNVIMKIKKEKKDIYEVYHFLYNKSGMEIFRNIEIRKKGLDAYLDHVIDRISRSEQCCRKGNCHLHVLSTYRHTNLEKIYTLLSIVKDSRADIEIILKVLERIKNDVYVNSTYTTQILDKLYEYGQIYRLNYFSLLKRLETDYQPYVNEIVKRIEHEDLIKYFNVEPFNNAGVIYKALWHINSDQYDKVKTLVFSDRNDDNFDELTELIFFLRSKIDDLSKSTNAEDVQDMKDAFEFIYMQSITYLSTKIDQFKRDDNFYYNLTKFICNGNFKDKAGVIFRSAKHYRSLMVKCKDLGLLIELFTHFLGYEKGIRTKYLEKMTKTFKLRLKNYPSTEIFLILRGFQNEGASMDNFIPLIDMLSLDECIILENTAVGRFKEKLKEKCVERSNAEK
ncbi:putative Armadillo-like helical protein, partial [Trachipleistophora hominis]